jgi:putative sterol carrier protein
MNLVNFTIETGKVEARKGAAETADLVIQTPFDLWMDIITRKADGQKMLMEQKYKITGDLGLMMALFKPEDGA